MWYYHVSPSESFDSKLTMFFWVIQPPLLQPALVMGRLLVQQLHQQVQVSMVL
jgi:hypothetical protein